MNKRIIKSIISIVFVVFTAGSIQAGDWATGEGSCFSKNSKEVSGGLSIFDFGFYAAYDMGFHDAISGGVATGFNWFGLDYYSRFAIPIVVRAAFHPFNLVALKDKISVRDKLDVYGGLSSGYSIGWTSWDSGPVSGTGLSDHGGFIFREYLGVRYFFKPNMALVAEDCGGLGILNFGICFKF
jgi:hypothetical protein